MSNINYSVRFQTPCDDTEQAFSYFYNKTLKTVHPCSGYGNISVLKDFDDDKVAAMKYFRDTIKYHQPELRVAENDNIREYLMVLNQSIDDENSVIGFIPIWLHDDFLIDLI